MCEMVQDDDSDSESEEEFEMLLWFMGFDMFLNEVQKSKRSPKVSGRSKKGGIPSIDLARQRCQRSTFPNKDGCCRKYHEKI
jgi:hypothetical protein